MHQRRSKVPAIRLRDPSGRAVEGLDDVGGLLSSPNRVRLSEMPFVSQCCLEYLCMDQVSAASMIAGVMVVMMVEQWHVSTTSKYLDPPTAQGIASRISRGTRMGAGTTALIPGGPHISNSTGQCGRLWRCQAGTSKALTKRNVLDIEDWRVE